MSLSPMMRQYHDAKAACGDALLLFRMGDFYELFQDDAKRAAQVLGLTLTTREKGENATPMAGFPHHQLESYLGKLVALGFRAAVCEQVEDPKQAKGLVKREVVRVVSRGTLTDEELLDPRQNNYLAAICPGPPAKGDGRSRPAIGGDKQTSAGRQAERRGLADEELGLAWADLSTGRFQAAVVPRATLGDQLARLRPAELLLPDDFNLNDGGGLDAGAGCVFTSRPAWAFAKQHAEKLLGEQFGAASLEGFGFDARHGLAVRAAGAVLDYLRETQRTSLAHIDRLLPDHVSQSLEIDQATRRGLEITRTLREGRREGSLLAALDRTTTALGARLLDDWLASPLRDVAAINERLDAVEELAGDDELRRDARQTLKSIQDLERLLARVVTQRATPRDLRSIGDTLGALPKLKARLTARNSRLLNQTEAELDLCPELRARLVGALAPDCPAQAREGGFIQPGWHPPLDELRELAAGGKQWIARYQASEIERTGIASLKVSYNKVFGYYIEITNAHRAKVPADYIRQQTIKNAERYVTPALKEYEAKVLSADERAREIEHELFVELRELALAHAARLRGAARALARLDVLAGLAELARQRDYRRPALTEAAELRVVEGRHPVLDALLPEGVFVPNDAFLGGEHGALMLITGPNMAGKSTYIRQTALLVIMAQMGSFVPAKSATIGVADRVFARVGASDELSRGQSTFMVEMTETARILHNATSRSLVILDEIGRGTSTYDGVSLAWAIVEHLHDEIGCRALFATHYHELTDLRSSLPGVRNFNVAVKEWDDQVVFLHKIVPGAADKSYGIHVARLAGVPPEVNERAKQILSLLENEHLDEEGRPKLRRRKKQRRGDIQLTLFGFEEHPLLDELRGLDLNTLSPLQALQQLQRWQSELKRG